MDSLKFYSPLCGSQVEVARPLIALHAVEGASTYVIEASVGPSFTANATISYCSSEAFEPIRELLTPGLQWLRFAGASGICERAPDGAGPSAWRLPVNLGSIVSRTVGLAPLPARSWLKKLHGEIVAGWDDPVEAVVNWVSFVMRNEGASSEYFNAYELLVRGQGVCGHAAELIVALWVAGGRRAHVVSLQAEDQGHVVAAVESDDGWWLVDGLYNIRLKGTAPELIARVAAEPDFLDFPAFAGVKVPYRHFFKGALYCYQIETMGGTRVEHDYDLSKCRGFADLDHPDTRPWLKKIAAQKPSATVWFLRATYLRDGEWAPWAYSWFVYRPADAAVDHASSVWRDGMALAEPFMPGAPVPIVDVKSRGGLDGYDPRHLIKPNGMAWLAVAPRSHIQLELGTEQVVDGLAVRFTAPGTAPTLRIEALHGKTYRHVADVAGTWPTAVATFPAQLTKRIRIVALDGALGCKEVALFRSPGATVAVEEAEVSDLASDASSKAPRRESPRAHESEDQSLVAVIM